MSNPTRVRPGVPSGGQFAATTHAESDVDLDTAPAGSRYAGMTRDEAWADYRSRHPEVLASYGQQNGYWPHDDRDDTTSGEQAGAGPAQQAARTPVGMCATCFDYAEEGAALYIDSDGELLHVSNDDVRCPGQDDDDTGDEAKLMSFKRYAAEVGQDEADSILARLAPADTGSQPA